MIFSKKKCCRLLDGISRDGQKRTLSFHSNYTPPPPPANKAGGM